MNLKKAIAFFYIAYTVYIILLIGTSTLTFYAASFAVFLMWVNYIFFSLGFNFKKKTTNQINNKENMNAWILKQSKPTLLLISGISLLFSVTALKYYTGQTPVDVFKNLFNNVSVYYEYQSYFSEQQLGQFSIMKIPFILMLFFIKFLLFYSYITFFKLKGETTTFEKIYLLLITISFVYFGIGRGTSFEFFELLIFSLYLLFSKQKKGNYLAKNLKSLIICLLLGSVAIFIFFSGISARGVEHDVTILRPGVNYDSNGWLTTLFPFLSFIVFRMYSYFGFGFYYVSTYVTDVWFSSVGNAILGFFPLGYQLNGGDSIHKVMESLVHVGVKWHPDFALLSNNLGYLGLLGLCFFMGMVSKYFNIIEVRQPITEITNFIVLLQMISLPVGNFLFTSSANQLIVMFVLIYWIWRVFINRRVTL